jgi:hypothetical protein
MNELEIVITRTENHLSADFTIEGDLGLIWFSLKKHNEEDLDCDIENPICIENESFMPDLIGFLSDFDEHFNHTLFTKIPPNISYSKVKLPSDYYDIRKILFDNKYFEYRLSCNAIISQISDRLKKCSDVMDSNIRDVIFRNGNYSFDIFKQLDKLKRK